MSTMYLKRYLIAFTIREIKTIMRYQYRPTRMAKIKSNSKHQILVRMWINWITATFLVRMYLENNIAVLTKPSMKLPCYSAILPLTLSQGNENLYSYKNLYVSVYSDFICNSSKLGSSHMTFNGWMVTYCMVHLYNILEMSKF